MLVLSSVRMGMLAGRAHFSASQHECLIKMDNKIFEVQQCMIPVHVKEQRGF